MNNTDIRTEVFLSDIHHPHTLTPAWNVALKVIKGIKPDMVYIGGDGHDMHALSRHPKLLVDRTMLKWELDESKIEWQRLRAFAPNSRIRFRYGNHDNRVDLFLNKFAPELEDLDELKLHNLVGMDDLGFEVVSDKAKDRIGRLYHIHGHEVPGGGMYPARAKFMKLRTDIIFGHHHRFDRYSERVYGGQVVQSHANAALYTTEPDYAHHTDWHIGFSIVRYARGGFYEVQQVSVHELDGVHFAIVGGREYESYEGETMRGLRLVKAAA